MSDEVAGPNVVVDVKQSVPHEEVVADRARRSLTSAAGILGKPNREIRLTSIWIIGEEFDNIVQIPILVFDAIMRRAQTDVPLGLLLPLVGGLGGFIHIDVAGELRPVPLHVVVIELAVFEERRRRLAVWPVYPF